MERFVKLIDSPGVVDSEVWGARTETIVKYIVVPDPPEPYAELETPYLEPNIGD